MTALPPVVLAAMLGGASGDCPYVAVQLGGAIVGAALLYAIVSGKPESNLSAALRQMDTLTLIHSISIPVASSATAPRTPSRAAPWSDAPSAPVNTQ